MEHVLARGRGRLGRPCGQVHRLATRSRSQRTKVAGWTKHCPWRWRGSNRHRPASTARPADCNAGRYTGRRSTATSWRRMTASTARLVSLWQKSWISWSADANERPIQERDGHPRMLARTGSFRQSPAQGLRIALSAPTSYEQGEPGLRHRIRQPSPLVMSSRYPPRHTLEWAP